MPRWDTEKQQNPEIKERHELEMEILCHEITNIGDVDRGCKTKHKLL